MNEPPRNPVVPRRFVDTPRLSCDIGGFDRLPIDVAEVDRFDRKVDHRVKGISPDRIVPGKAAAQGRRPVPDASDHGASQDFERGLIRERQREDIALAA